MKYLNKIVIHEIGFNSIEGFLNLAIVAFILSSVLIILLQTILKVYFKFVGRVTVSRDIYIVVALIFETLEFILSVSSIVILFLGVYKILELLINLVIK